MNKPDILPGEPALVDRDFFLAEEGLLVRHSGEIPEVALHGSLYYLTAAPEGPGLQLSAAEHHALEEQAVRRYREMIARDLAPENRDLSFYRGLARAVVNWRRLARFCRRTDRDAAGYRQEAAAALAAFLRREAAEVEAGTRLSSINCSAGELEAFARELGLQAGTLPVGWQRLCPEAGVRDQC